MKSFLLGSALTIGLSVSIVPSSASELFTVRSLLPAPETMTRLQDAIVARGYTISRLQDVSSSRSKRNFQSDGYRAECFAKPEEIKALSASHPASVPYLRLNVTIFTEGDQTILTANHSRFLAKLFPDPALTPVFGRWERDLGQIIDSAASGW